MEEPGIRLAEQLRDCGAAPAPVDPRLPSIYQDLECVLFDEGAIRKKVRELGRQITRDYRGERLFLVSVLKGSVVFLADIVREVEMPVEFGFIRISTYEGGTSPCREPFLEGRTIPEVRDKQVLLVEDILDTGSTIAFAKRRLKENGAAGVKTCVLLAKEGYAAASLAVPDYLGFRIPRVFVVGYGLDFREKYRNLKCIGVLKPDLCELENGREENREGKESN